MGAVIGVAAIVMVKLDLFLMHPHAEIQLRHGKLVLVSK
jgi:hypothetical protein